MTDQEQAVETGEETGEELYVRARAITHRMIPTIETDEAYLTLLFQSAAKGYPRAMFRLGDYAMRRQAWVEAYYWIKMAEKAGGEGVVPVLQNIRRNWVRMRYPNQSGNVNEHFSRDQSAIGLAFLSIDSGHGALSAKEFLRTHHPELIERKP